MATLIRKLSVFSDGSIQSANLLPMVQVVWDDQNIDYNYKSRTQMPGWDVPDNPPAVYRFYPEMRDNSGDYRVNLDSPYNWKPQMIELNDGDESKWGYLVGPSRAQYNNTGWPMQAYLTMSGNKLQGEFIGNWYRFITLKQSDLSKVKGMTIVSHPQFVHRFTCVSWDSRTRTTVRINSTGTQKGQVYYYLITKEGYAYIPKRHVILPSS